MQSYFLAVPLPQHIRSRVTGFCYGLPNVHWVEEENLHITLRFLGPLNDSALADIHERLNSIFFSPFSLILQGAGHFHSKSNRGVIWIGVAENPHLFSLKKEINNQLRSLILPSEESFQPHLTLGYYERLNPQRLGDYLMALTDYQSEPIEIDHCILMRSQQTPKRMIYEILESYEASPHATGED